MIICIRIHAYIAFTYRNQYIYMYFICNMHVHMHVNVLVRARIYIYIRTYACAHIIIRMAKVQLNNISY